jgi:hypothetical protein
MAIELGSTRLDMLPLAQLASARQPEIWPLVVDPAAAGAVGNLDHLNCRSSSLKFRLYRVGPGASIVKVLAHNSKT